MLGLGAVAFTATGSDFGGLAAPLGAAPADGMPTMGWAVSRGAHPFLPCATAGTPPRGCSEGDVSRALPGRFV